MKRIVAKLFCGLFLIVSPLALAGRDMYPPPLNLNSLVDFTKSYLGVPVTMATIASSYGNRLGSQIAIEFTLFNLSNTVQTGFLGLLAGSLKAHAACSHVSGTYYFPQSILSLCGGTNVDVSMAAAPNTNLATSPSVTFSIAPLSFTRVIVTLQVAGSVGNSPSTGCPAAYSLSFAPNIVLHVNEDRGAILGSYVYYVRGLDTYGTYSTCAGTTLSNNHWDGFYEKYPPTPIPINGGRPF